MLQIQNNKTMSSREIAELTNKEHKNVLTDIRIMLNKLELHTAGFSAVYQSDNGQKYHQFNFGLWVFS